MNHAASIMLILFLCAWMAPVSTSAGEQPLLLSLEEALTIALKQNPDVAEAQSRLAESEARLRAAKAGGWPTIKARGTYDYWEDNQRLAQPTGNNQQSVFGPQVVTGEVIASIPIYTGGRVPGESDEADWNRKAAMDRLIRLQESLAYEITTLYYTLLAQDEVLRSLDIAIRAMDEQQRTIQALVEMQKAARVDLLRANVRRAELYERRVRERNSRMVQQRAWAALLGLDDTPAPDVKGSLKLYEANACPDSVDCIQKALAQRADYRAAQAAVAAADAAVRAARSGYVPTLSAQVSYGGRWLLVASDQPEGTDNREDFGRIGLVLELPLFDGRLTAAKVAEQKARRNGEQARLRKLELQIRFEVETALSDIASARERMETAEQAVGQAEESFRIMKEKYDLGKGTMTDVLDAQTALVLSQTSYARALADLAIADARRRLSLGEILP